MSGTCELGENLQIGYFEQEVKGENRTTCIEEIWQEFPSFTQYEVRSALAKCGLTTKHIESQVRVLSGGEQAKVRLCKLINRDTNILLLDEPTNHLDVDAKDSLKKALQEYRGSVLLICHEPEFYQDVVTRSMGLQQVDNKSVLKGTPIMNDGDVVLLKFTTSPIDLREQRAKVRACTRPWRLPR